MYTRISIKNFRAIASLEATDLRPINLIVGRNNCAKTTFLEALFLLGGAPDPRLPTTLGILRGQRLNRISSDQFWRPLFHNFNPGVLVNICGIWNGQPQQRNLEIEALLEQSPTGLTGFSGGEDVGVASTMPDLAVHELHLATTGMDGRESSGSAIFESNEGRIRYQGRRGKDMPPTTFLSARRYPSSAHEARRLSAILKNKEDRLVTEALRLIGPDVQRVEVVLDADEPSVYLDIGLPSLVPLSVSGEGMVRLFSIIVELIESRDGVLLIDEIDNGLHHTVMPKLWKLLGELVQKHHVQVFGTTHNDEMMRLALEAFAGTEGTLGLFRIDKRGDRHVMVGYSDEAMEAVLEIPYEVRG